MTVVPPVRSTCSGYTLLMKMSTDKTGQNDMQRSVKRVLPEETWKNYIP